jgi:hypothetical protein
VSAFKGLIATVFMVTALFCLSASAAAIECIHCHTDAEKLRRVIDTLPDGNGRGALWRTGPAEALDRTQRVLVGQAFFDDLNHSDLGCDECHGGDPDATDYETAHQDIVRDPSFPAPGVCADCHSEADYYEDTLHYNIKGIIRNTVIRSSSKPAVREKVNEAFDAHCIQCHGSCGQCHIGRPQAAGGGLTDGHAFKRSPDSDTCLTCHGRGFKNEWQGDGAEFKGDIHFTNAGMTCRACHTFDQLHGDGESADRRYAVHNGPKCLDCHTAIYDANAENKEAHNLHKDRVSCQVCHAQAYTNCSDCHIDPAGATFDKTLREWNTFKIGRNPFISEERPEKFVTVRRIPAQKDLFKGFVPDGLSNFDTLPTWMPATPHNIQRQTVQNKSCNACHGQWDLYLMTKDVESSDRVANRPVIVPPKNIPKPIVESEEE